MGNMFKTAVLLAFLTALLLLVGEVLGGSGGLTIALIFALGMNFVSYWYSDKIALSMAGAHEVTPAEAPGLHAIVADVAGKAGLPKPRVYIVDNASPNAFATGRDPQHAAVAATSGILQILSPDELAGVLAHEMAHIRNRDTLIATVAATIAGAITYLAQMGQWALMFGGFGGRRDSRSGGFGGEALLMIILAPLAALLIQLAISRSREYNADATGARITGDPLALANALERLERQIAYRPMTNAAPTTAPLYIVNPFGPGMFQKLFSDHPPTAERVARLRKQAFQEIR